MARVKLFYTEDTTEEHADTFEMEGNPRDEKSLVNMFTEYKKKHPRRIIKRIAIIG